MTVKRKYGLPPGLARVIDRQRYERWLRRKAAAHRKRDGKRWKRWGPVASAATYRRAIHAAVLNNPLRDPYTGERLDWSLVSTWDNDDAERDGRVYKARFARMPSVDHVGDHTHPLEFVICCFRTNDAKNDLSSGDFLALCRAVVEHADRPKRRPRPRSTRGGPRPGRK
jgi:hypothetical protein